MSSRVKGFSLIELLVVLGIAIFVIVAIWLLWSGSFRFNTEIRNNLTLIAEARRAGDLMTREIRSITHSPDGSYPILEAEPFSLSFFTIDTSGQILKIRYFEDSNQLKRGVIYPNQVSPYYDDDQEQVTTILKDVGSKEYSLFEYFDSEYQPNDSPLPSPVDIFSVQLIGVSIYNQNSEITFSTKISLRNIKDNL